LFRSKTVFQDWNNRIIDVVQYCQYAQVIVMQTALRMGTTILPGHRLEITAPELSEGAKVEVIVVLPETPQPHRVSMLEFLKSLPSGPRAFPTWEEHERHLREEKDAWER
jgi:hypothetical protein